MRRIIALTLLLAIAAVSVPAWTIDGPGSVRITPPAPRFTDAERQAELARRRKAVAARMDDNSVMILMSGQPRIYANDVDYMFRQENNLYYLTNLKQTDATLVIRKSAGGVTETIYMPNRDPQQETWTGRMYSKDDAKRISGISSIVDTDQWSTFLNELQAKKDAAITKVYLLLPSSRLDSEGVREYRTENELANMLSSAYKIANARNIFDDLRQIKSPFELKLLQHAIDITTEAQMRGWAAARKAKMEYEVQAEVEYTFRRRNADYWGYPSIVGCGPNATTLHYEESQGPITPGKLLLMDVGAEYDHYTADVTRTVPVNGKFTKEQAEIYQIVYDAQEAVAKASKPGATMFELNKVADTVLRNGLFRLGLTTDNNSDQFRIWYMHSVGHWLGMNVHDVGRNGIELKPGMTFTNEPGIYIREDALSYLPDTPQNRAFIAKVKPAFEKYKNIGVRIEDDMLITETGVEWMTRNLPRSIKEIEEFMAAASVADHATTGESFTGVRWRAYAAARVF